MTPSLDGLSLASVSRAHLSLLVTLVLAAPLTSQASSSLRAFALALLASSVTSQMFKCFAPWHHSGISWKITSSERSSLATFQIKPPPPYYHLCQIHGAHFGSTYTKIGPIQRRLAWPVHKDDTLIHVFFSVCGTCHLPQVVYSFVNF